MTEPRAVSNVVDRRGGAVGVALFGALIVTAAIAFGILDIVAGHRRIISDAAAHLESQARTLAEQTAQSIQVVDVTLRHVAEHFKVDGLPESASREMHEFLREQAAGAVQIDGLAIFHANGTQIGVSGQFPPPASAPAPGQLVAALRDHPKLDLHTDTSTHHRTDDEPILVLARPIVDETGGLVGHVSARIRAEYFQRLYDSIQLTLGTKIALIRRDTVVLARHPPSGGSLGKVLPLPAPLLASLKAGGNDAVRAADPIDGRDRIWALRSVPGYPLQVAMSAEVESALAPWHRQAMGIGVRLLLLSTAIAVLLAVLLRQLTRLCATRDSLEASEARYERAMMASNEGHWDWNLVTDEEYFSPRARELYGLGQDDAITTGAQYAERIAIHPHDRSRRKQAISEHLAGKTPRYDIEYRIQRKSGEIRWLRVCGLCFRDTSGKPIRMAGSTTDITERKRAEADRELLEAKLRQAHKLEAIGTLAGGIAHDFNNILAAILGYGEMAQKAAQAGSALRSHIDNMMTAGQRAKALVERILAFSRSGMGERVSVHVQTAVSEALDLVAGSLPARIRLERELLAGDAAIMGDPTQVHQVVMNLSTNALQAMKAEGTLAVRLDCLELDAPRGVVSGSLAPGRYVRLSVSDTGDGIEPRVLDRIFDPFFTTKEIGVGTGLGLSMVHGIVTDLGGGIEVASRVGAGSTFSIYLPCQGQVATPTSALEKEGPVGAGETILLIDDEEPLVRLGEELLAELGYEPVGFTSSASALEAFRSDPERFDVVVTDEMMPGMTGSQIAREIRRLRRDMPIILMSGYLAPATVARARAAGASDILAKPLAAGDMARVLATVLGSHSCSHAT